MGGFYPLTMNVQLLSLVGILGSRVSSPSLFWWCCCGQLEPFWLRDMLCGCQWPQLVLRPLQDGAVPTVRMATQSLLAGCFTRNKIIVQIKLNHHFGYNGDGSTHSHTYTLTHTRKMHTEHTDTNTDNSDFLLNRK